MQQLAYDLGFRDGIMFVVRHLRFAADQVEKPTRATFKKDDREITAISRTGQPHLASKYRDLANVLEQMVTQ